MAVPNRVLPLALVLLGGCSTSTPEVAEELRELQPEVVMEIDAGRAAVAVDPAPARVAERAAGASAPDNGQRDAWLACDVAREIEEQDAAIAQGRGETALAQAEGAARRSPRDPARAYLAGRLLALLRGLAPARKAFEAALALDPGFAWAHHGLGVIHLREGDPSRAREEFEKAVAGDPQNARVLVSLADSRFEAAQGLDSESHRQRGFLESRALLEQARTLAPEDPRVAIDLATVEAALGRTGEALELATFAAGKAPRDARVLAQHARILEDADRLEEAAEAYGRVLSVSTSGEEAELARRRLARIEEVFSLARTSEIEQAAGLEELGPFLASSDPLLRRQAYKKLRQLRHAADAPAFLRGLADADRGVRIHSIWALGELRATWALPDLLALLSSDPDELARGAVGKALVDLGATGAIPALVEALQKEESLYVIEQIDFALRKLSGDDPLAGQSGREGRGTADASWRVELHRAWSEWLARSDVRPEPR
ncbi:MAG: HEAT repeat domain-containing protein [Planctomycetes bacterium]|nr:HEAT repeat domain-containing protein [Planctomycetota bacterium]